MANNVGASKPQHGSAEASGRPQQTNDLLDSGDGSGGGSGGGGSDGGSDGGSRSGSDGGSCDL